MDKNHSQIDEKLEGIQAEVHSIIKLYKSIDLYEYFLKLQVIYLMHEITISNDEKLEKEKNFINLKSIVQNNLQRPSLGHWVSMLRELSKLIIILTEDDSKRLKEIVKDSEEIVQIRNRLAHGITPAPEVAEEEYNRILPKLQNFYDYFKESDIYGMVSSYNRNTPLYYDVFSIYNSVKKQTREECLCEYINYFDGNRIITSPKPDLKDYFKRYFQVSIEIANFELKSLLQNYFSRQYWEDEVDRKLECFDKLFICGYAGVGKTTLAARIAEKYNSDIFLYSMNRPAELKAIRSMEMLYNSFRIRIGALPPIPETCDENEIEDYIRLVISRYKEARDKSNIIYVIDGLDELPEKELSKFYNYLHLFRDTSVKLVICSRSKDMLEQIECALGHMEQIHIEPLTEGEVREWFISRNPNNLYPSDMLIKSISNFSEGNFLFLKSLPILKNEEEYFEYLSKTPSDIKVVYERMLSKYEAIDERVLELLALISVTPNGCPKELIRDFFDLDRRETKELLSIISDVIKEIEEGVYVLFHSKFLEFVRVELKKEIKKVYNKLITGIEGYESIAYKLSDIPRIIYDGGTVDDLEDWFKRHIEAIDRYINSEERFNVLTAIVEALRLLKLKDKFRVVESLPSIEKLIDLNFQVMLDWKLGRIIKECIEDIQYVVDFNSCPIAGLLFGAVLHDENDFDSSLIVLNEIRGNFLKGSLNYLRCTDYIGLTYAKTNRPAKAISEYSSVIESVSENSNNLWLGYALMNRGRQYLKISDLDKAINDLERAVRLREAIAFNKKCFDENSSDMVNHVQAYLTLAMGYENLVKFYMQQYKGGDLKNEKLVSNVNRLELHMESMLDKYQDETKGFAFTARMLITLVEYYKSAENEDKVNKYLPIIKECYITEMEEHRLGGIIG